MDFCNPASGQICGGVADRTHRGELQPRTLGILRAADFFDCSHFKFEFLTCLSHSFLNERKIRTRTMKTNRRLLDFAAMTSLLLVTAMNIAYADEGMWLLNNPPRKQIKEKYGFEIT